MDNKKNAKPEAEKAKPEEKLSDDDLNAVTGGAERSRERHHGRITTGPEGYIVPLK